MTARHEFADRDLLTRWILSLVVVVALPVLAGADLPVVGFLALAVTVAVFGNEAWNRRKSAEETGSVRNRRDVTITRNNEPEHES